MKRIKGADFKPKHFDWRVDGKVATVTLNRPDRKIITVEDPVEYEMSGINQVQVRAQIARWREAEA